MYIPPIEKSQVRLEVFLSIERRNGIESNVKGLNRNGEFFPAVIVETMYLPVWRGVIIKICLFQFAIITLCDRGGFNLVTSLRENYY